MLKISCSQARLFPRCDAVDRKQYPKRKYRLMHVLVGVWESVYPQQKSKCRK